MSTKTIQLSSIVQKQGIVIDNLNNNNYLENNFVYQEQLKNVKNQIEKEIEFFKRQTKSKQWKSAIKRKRR